VHAGSHGEPAEAERLVAEVRELNENAHNPFVEPQMLTTLGNLAYRDGDFQRARDLHRRSVEAAAASGLVTWELWELASVAEVELRLDLLREAESTCRRALELARRLRDRDLSLWLLTLLAVLAARQGELERAGAFWGTVTEQERERPVLRSWDELAAHRTLLVDSTDPGFLDAVEQGRLRSIGQAIRIALDEDPQAVP